MVDESASTTKCHNSPCLCPCLVVARWFGQRLVSKRPRTSRNVHSYTQVTTFLAPVPAQAISNTHNNAIMIYLTPWTARSPFQKAHRPSTGARRQVTPLANQHDAHTPAHPRPPALHPPTRLPPPPHDRNHNPPLLRPHLLQRRHLDRGPLRRRLRRCRQRGHLPGHAERDGGDLY